MGMKQPICNEENILPEPWECPGLVWWCRTSPHLVTPTVRMGLNCGENDKCWAVYYHHTP